jgi:hypothetical protein
MNPPESVINRPLFNDRRSYLIKKKKDPGIMRKLKHLALNPLTVPPESDLSSNLG